MIYALQTCLQVVLARKHLTFFIKVTECDRFILDLTWSGLRPGGTHVYSSSAQPESSSDCECRCGSPVDGANGDPLPKSLSDGSKDGILPPGDGSAGGDIDAFTLLSLVDDMLVSGQG